LDQGIAYSHGFQMPLHNFTDDLSWTRGSHSFQFGGNIGIARDPRVSYQHSFSTAFGTTSWMAPTGFANTGGGSTLDPANQGYPEPINSVAYDYPNAGRCWAWFLRCRATTTMTVAEIRWLPVRQ